METERLVIRRFTPCDWRDLHAYLSEEETVRYEPYGVFTPEASQQEAARRAQDSRFWAVCLKDGGKLIGNITLTPQEDSTWEIGYVFGLAYRGAGYATEAAGFLVNELFETQKARRVTALCNPLNTASWKLLERLGFRREGCFKQNIAFKTDADGHPLWQDTYAYAILSGEWRARMRRTTY